MYYQTRKTRNKYHSFPPSADCHFCDPHKNTEHIFEETQHAYVIPNRTFYDQWELRKVIDHRMVIPKQHTNTLNDLSTEALTDIMQIIARYESEGYEVYARSPGSSSRSVPHQHTHLIKTEAHPRWKRMIFMQKPYILWLFR
ncbi:MAG TPA: HIT domain-containing protein [Candidatus Saccharimonadales bacterium]